MSPLKEKITKSDEEKITKSDEEIAITSAEFLEKKSKFEKSRRKNLDILAKEAQDLNLGYD